MERFTEIPTWQTQVAIQERVIRVQFGEGYEQRLRDGINAEMLKWEVRFTGIRSAKAARVMAFLRARGSVEAFAWTPPAPYDTPGMFTLPEGFNHEFIKYDNETITAVFKRDFNPAARVAVVVIVAIEDPDNADNMLVTLTSATAGAEIRYTVDSDDEPAKPTYATGTVYTVPFSVPWGYLRAIAWKAGLLDSAVSYYDGRTSEDADYRVTTDGDSRVTTDGELRTVIESSDLARATTDGDSRVTTDDEERITIE